MSNLSTIEDFFHLISNLTLPTVKQTLVILRVDEPSSDFYIGRDDCSVFLNEIVQNLSGSILFFLELTLISFHVHFISIVINDFFVFKHTRDQ